MSIQGTNLFSSGQVLTASQVNQYLMRGVKVFASSTIRDAAYGGAGEPTLFEGEVCYLTDSNSVQYYTGSAWVNLLDATTGIAQSIVDAKGDLIAATAADTVGRLAVGTNGALLKANSGTTTGLEWSTIGNLAYVETNQSTSSTSYTALATAGPSVTLTTGTSAFVVFGCWGNDTGNLGNNQKMSIAVSGATTIAASDSWMAYGSEGLNGVSMVNGYIFTTLTAGSNTFTAQYAKVGGTSTAEFTRRFLQVFAL